MIDWLLVDYGETISRPFASDAINALAQLAGQTPARFIQTYWQLRADYDLGQPSEHYWSRVLDRDPCELGPLVTELNRIDVQGWLHLNMATLRTLQRHSRRTGARLALLSNAPETLAVTLDQCHWAQQFTHRFYSCRLRQIKPDPAVFTTVLGLLDANPGQVAFIDDRADNTQAASALGIPTITFTSASALGRELTSMSNTRS